MSDKKPQTSCPSQSDSVPNHANTTAQQENQNSATINEDEAENQLTLDEIREQLGGVEMYRAGLPLFDKVLHSRVSEPEGENRREWEEGEVTQMELEEGEMRRDYNRTEIKGNGLSK
jgi:hypothetical protein